ncbi:hypothetical protein ACTMTI_56355 [Nonomuraea sp. H19]|uniref:hypothetical protein n=1 Tax=Nonomuraea sp. H19 TaxID=3452206 RepID=UPI003F8C82A7
MKSINGGGAARGMIRVFAVVFVLVLSLTPPPARAHVVEAGADLRVTQTFGTGEVTLVIAGVSLVCRPATPVRTSCAFVPVTRSR